MEVAVKQKGSGDVTVLLFEGENGPQVLESINNHVACENEESWSFFNQVGKGIGKAGDVITIKLENPRLWSPDHPFLYKLQVGTETTTTFCNCWRFLSRLDSVLETR